MRRNIKQRQRVEQYDGYYGQELEMCVNSKQLFEILNKISTTRNVGNFDKYLISLSMNKLMKLQDFNACKQLYRWIKQQNEQDNYDQYTLNFAAMTMLYVCTQFANKYVYALSLFYNEIIPNITKYSNAHLNKCYLYIINGAALNNQYISGKLIIDLYFNQTDHKKFETSTINAVLKFYLHFDKIDNALDVFDNKYLEHYQSNRDINTYIFLLNYYSKMNDTKNMIKYLNEYLRTKVIKNFARHQATKILFMKQHIVLKLPNAILLPIANYYRQHGMLGNFLMMIKSLLNNDDLINNPNQNHTELDGFIGNALNEGENDDPFRQEIFDKLLNRRKPIYHDFATNQLNLSWEDRTYEHDEDNSLVHSFVFQSEKIGDKLWFELLKCIGNYTNLPNNKWLLKDKWLLIDCITSKMKQDNIDFNNNIYYGLFISLCDDDLDKAMHFYHKLIAISSKRYKNTLNSNVGSQQRLVHNIFLEDYKSDYQVVVPDLKNKDINTINMFKPSHQELFSLLRVGLKHHTEDLQRKRAFCHWWLNELKRLNVKPSKIAVELITSEWDLDVSAQKQIQAEN